MKRFLPVVFAALLATTMMAQAPGNGFRRGAGRMPVNHQQRVQRHVDFLATQLSLTDDQKQKATEIFTQASTASEPLRKQMATVRKGLAEAMKSGASDLQIDQLATGLGSLTAQLASIDAKAHTHFQTLLTDDQKVKAASLFRGGRMGGGPRAMGRGGWASKQ